MSKTLVDLLGVDEREFRKLIQRLEHVSLQPSIDIRLTTEITSRVREKIRTLGLEIDDTTAKELYYALKSRLKQDDEALRHVLGIESASPEKIATVLAETATKLSAKEHALSISPAGVKRILEAVPPRKTLKLLRLRSLTSVLKREDARMVYALAAQLEDDSWRAQVAAKIKRLPAKDIGWHEVAALAVSDAWYQKCKERLAMQGLQLVCDDVAAVLLLPASAMKKPGMVTLALGFVLQALQRLTINSTPYRREGFMQGYHQVMPEIVSGNQPVLMSIHGLTLNWRIVHEMVAKGHLESHMPDMDLALRDLEWQTSEMKLATISSNFDFWVDTHFLGTVADNGVVSLHILDIASAVIRDLHYGEQTATHLQTSLWNELCIRYLREDALSKALAKQLLPDEALML